MKTAVIGAGAMGCLFGAKIAEAGNEVVMLDVVPEVIHAISHRGLILEERGEEKIVPAKACKSEDWKEEVELVILFTKTLYSKAALESAKHFLTEKTWIMSVQNGLGNEELIQNYVDPGRIVIGSTNWASDLKGPGHAAVTGSGYVKIMSADKIDSPKLEEISDMLSDAGLNCIVTQDVFTAIWEKCGFNAAMNTMTAICKIPCKGIGRVEEGVYTAYEIARETEKTARAYGVPVSADQIIKNLQQPIFGNHGDHLTSMCQDVLKQKKTEGAFIIGKIIERAEKKGIQTPYSKALYSLLRIVEETYDIQR